MNNTEERLLTFLVNYGEPNNILVYKNLMTFVLKNPTFETNMTLVIKFQEALLKEFPEFNILKKLVNNKEQFWTVLLKDE